MFLAKKTVFQTSSHTPKTFLPSQKLRQFSDVKATTLTNGVRVVSFQPQGSPLTSLGLFVGQAGSRGEKATTSGSSQYLKRLGYKGTQKLDKDTRALLLEHSGAQLEVSAAREYLLYGLDVPSSNASAAVPAYGQSLQPKLEEYLVEDQRENVEHESAEHQSDLSDKVHQIAYRHVGLGSPLYASVSQAQNLTVDLVKYQYGKSFRNKNLSVVGVGVDHSTLESWAATNFAALDWEPEHGNRTKYQGGEALFVSDASPVLAVGFEAPNLSHKDRLAAQVLQSLVGGSRPSPSSSYDGLSIQLGSANGSRLSQSVASEFDGAQVTAQYSPYSDSGLFFVEAHYSNSTHGTGIVNAIVAELRSVADGKVSAEELSKAKTIAKVSLAESLQTGADIVKFLGEQSLGSSSVLTPEQFLKKVDEVSVADLQRVVKSLIQSNPTLVGLGDVAEGLPTLEHVKKQLK
eukprot:TRINITY_DN72_c0_g1_i1.p1 TRINITY_DN72_c0_g1~~TRINITY_DN72_c0_g1_i1.p1  ORF type:complete len:488 (+),score=155.88 TRINITY_DN72_c0_g1_i1:86-1465(+)